jgi:LysM repeat protein
MRPEFRDNFAESFANRVRSGDRSQKYFSYGRMHEAGLLQQVKGIPPGARVRFSIWIQAWMCFDSAHCGKVGEKSDQPSNMHLRVGIDPLGGTDPFTPTIVWSVEQPAWDKFTLFQIETAALTDTVTVFTHSRPEWDWARGNNDVYLDDASLVIVGAYTTPTATATLTGAVSTPALYSATAMPFPPGAVTHTLQMGDTLFDVALRYGLRVSDLLRLNRLTTQTQLYLEQPLVIRIETLTPTPLSSPTLPPPSETPTPRPSETPQPTGTPVPVVATLVPPTPQPLPSVLPIIVIIAAGLSVVVVLIILVVRAARS